MLVVRSVAGPMVVRRRDTVVRSAPVVTPSTSASHSGRNCRGACTARSPSSRRWLALGTSMIDPSGLTPHTAPSTCTEAGVASWGLTEALSHLARRSCSTRLAERIGPQAGSFTGEEKTVGLAGGAMPSGRGTQGVRARARVEVIRRLLGKSELVIEYTVRSGRKTEPDSTPVNAVPDW